MGDRLRVTIHTTTDEPLVVIECLDDDRRQETVFGSEDEADEFVARLGVEHEIVDLVFS